MMNENHVLTPTAPSAYCSCIGSAFTQGWGGSGGVYKKTYQFTEPQKTILLVLPEAPTAQISQLFDYSGKYLRTIDSVDAWLAAGGWRLAAPPPPSLDLLPRHQLMMPAAGADKVWVSVSRLSSESAGQYLRRCPCSQTLKQASTSKLMVFAQCTAVIYSRDTAGGFAGRSSQV